VHPNSVFIQQQNSVVSIEITFMLFFHHDHFVLRLKMSFEHDYLNLEKIIMNCGIISKLNL
jgi:hypothetical protein